MKTSIAFVLLLFLPVFLSGQVQWTTSIDDVSSFSSPRAADLNSDGIPDIVLGAGVDGEARDDGYVAINGANGNVLWSVPSHDQIFGSAIFQDISNDGRPDVFMGGRNAELKAINGSTGEVIWQFYDFSTGNIPGDDGYWNFYSPQWIPDQDNDGFQDLLVANGGNHELPIFETDRPPGHLMVISAATGQELAYAEVPDGKETYMSALVHDFQNNGSLEVIFGTGGEGIDGKLWRTSLQSVLNNDLSGATILVNSDENGFIAPPTLADMNLDGVLDIVCNAYDGRVIALNGANNNVIWESDVPGAETNSSPAIGYFNNDNVPDVFSTYAVGVAPSFNNFIQFMLDGVTGEKLWEGELGVFHFASPLVFDIDNDGKEEVIQSINEQDGGTFTTSILSIDFDDNEINTLIGPSSGFNINATPWIGDINENGTLDIVYSKAEGNSFAQLDDGLIVERFSVPNTNVTSTIPMGAYMGTNYDGIYMGNPPNLNCTYTLEFESIDNDCFLGTSGIAGVESNGCPNPNDCEYLWSNGSTEAVVQNLTAGEYSVSITHPDDCVVTGSVVIFDPPGSPFSLQIQNATCFNSTDGGISINNLDPTFDYNFVWNTSSIESAISNVGVGSYSVSFVDQNDCDVTLEGEITSPAPIVVDTELTGITCTGESDATIEVDLESAVAPYTISWTGDFVGSDILSLSNLPSGTYNLTITDGNSCSYQETFEVEEPVEIAFDFDVQNITCFEEADGNVQINMTGGTAPFVYNFNGAVVGPTLSEIFIRDNLGPGTYPFSVTDDNLCVFEAMFTITQFEILTELTPASAFGESDGLLVLNVSHGVPPYSVNINGTDYTEFPINFTLTGGNGINVIASDGSGCEIIYNEFSPYLGIYDIEAEILEIYPNPSSGLIQLPKLECHDDWEIRLYDGTAQLISSWDGPISQLDMGNMSAGIYLLEVACSKRLYQAKVVRLQLYLSD